MFFLIWGFRTRMVVTGRGSFDCPICVAQQPFELRQVARWFRLFFLPIAKTRPLGEFVFCLGCRNTLRRGVLDAGSDAVPVPAPHTSATVAPGSTATTTPHDVPSGTETTLRPAASAPATARPAAAALNRASRPATVGQNAPLNANAVRLAPRPAAAARPSALTGGAAIDAEQGSEAHERPAFGQSAFAKATYARQRRPAPAPFGGSVVSEPAFFTPRR